MNLKSTLCEYEPSIHTRIGQVLPGVEFPAVLGTTREQPAELPPCATFQVGDPICHPSPEVTHTEKPSLIVAHSGVDQPSSTTWARCGCGHARLRMTNRPRQPWPSSCMASGSTLSRSIQATFRDWVLTPRGNRKLTQYYFRTCQQAAQSLCKVRRISDHAPRPGSL